jgi:hypothetical protein
MDPEAILARAEKTLGSKLPAGFAFNRTVCLDRIRALQARTGYGRGYEEAVVRAFLEEASQNPQVYAAGQRSETGKSGPHSSAPQNATSSAPESVEGDIASISERVEGASASISRSYPLARLPQGSNASPEKSGVGGFIRKLFGRKRT